MAIILRNGMLFRGVSVAEYTTWLRDDSLFWQFLATIIMVGVVVVVGCM